MKRHPLSVVWGDMPPEQFAELVKDVRSHGVKEPIVAYDEMILDGWHRYRAAAKAEKTCKFVALPEGEDPAGFVIRRNAHRRHLTAMQRAEAVVRCHSWMGRGKPKSSTNDLFSGKAAATEENPPNGGFKTDRQKPVATTAQMAKEAGAGQRTVERAKAKVEAESKPKDPKKPAKPKREPCAKFQAINEELEKAVMAFKFENEDLHTKNDELEERIAFVQAESAPVGAVREEKFNNYRAHIQTLKHSVYRWTTQFQESNAENKALRRRLRALGENIRP